MVVKDGAGRVALHTDSLASSLVDVIYLGGGNGERAYPELAGFVLGTTQIYGPTVGGGGKRMHGVAVDYGPGYPLVRWWQQTGDVAPTTLYVMSVR
ncbi:hypothetical protein BI344_08645 [Chromobacterium sphagni]|uniref:Uncharacterized protein n=1 Tax=Chromobacterium sphagni TaxID=1903179 RepID=A0ABX3CEG2_9NEIS|nr:hypothetical protein BI344_08645 [Chromobacterium sphagni]